MEAGKVAEGGGWGTVTIVYEYTVGEIGGTPGYLKIMKDYKALLSFLVPDDILKECIITPLCIRYHTFH
jgi:hypothetical protein